MKTSMRLGAQRPPKPRAAAGFVPYRLPHPERYPFELDLAHVVPGTRIRAALAAKAYSCYVLGDVGGIVDPAPQRWVAEAMCALSGDAARYDPERAPCGGTLFAYIVGDVVYNHGARAQYLPQFYAPYERYTRPILAIPGNHDGDLDGPTRESLDGFIANFCAPYQGPAEDAGPLARHALDQPNVYWTLEAPWLRIVGLYTNVPEGGVVEEEQRRWFLEQMARPLDGKHLIVALHQPVFSADDVHGGSSAMLDLIHEPARRAGCRLVLSGHVHNYQRFEFDGITYVVAGGGGYYGLHALLPPEFPGAMYPLVAHTTDYSFVHMSITPEGLTLRAIAVPSHFSARSATPRLVDRYTVGR
ncbi:MAG TPA: metallophosphoesterase [Chloroflexota bacterium]|nr:metallophosphoesterase [Chloroflexota bacterium]